jgi:hypothetical protein
VEEDELVESVDEPFLLSFYCRPYLVQMIVKDN